MAAANREPTPLEWKPRFWIFQGTPDRYDLLEGNRLEPGHVTRWTVSQHKKDIRGGDFVFLWRAKGNTSVERGIWGWGVAEADAVEDDKMPVRVVARFPSAVKASAMERGLRGLSILKSPQGTNFKVTDEEAALLAPLIEAVGGEPPPLPLDGKPPLSVSSRRALEGARRIAEATSQERIHLGHLVIGLALKPTGQLARDLQSTSGRGGTKGSYLGDLWSSLGHGTESLPELAYGDCPPIDFVPRLTPHALRALIEADHIRRAEGRDWVDHADFVAGMRAVPDAAATVALEKFLAPGESVRDVNTAPAAENPNVSTFLADAATGQDKLGVEVDAKAMAALIASRELAPPLAIGLFGGWGSGKSFFMNLVQHHVERFCGAARAASIAQQETIFCERDLHIRFNAWHYADANLWASLVNGILEGVSQHLKLSLSASDKRDRLVEKLQTYNALLEEAKEEEKAAERALEQARLARERAGVREQLAGTLLRTGEALGFASEEDVRKLTTDLGRHLTAPGRFVRRVRWAVLRPRGFVFFVLAAATAALGSGWGKSLLVDVAGATTPLLASLTTGVAALLQALPLQRGWKALGSVSDLLDSAERIEAEPPSVDPEKDRDEVLAPYVESARKASADCAELEDKRRALAIQIESLAPQRQLRELIQARTESDSPYRQAEGLIAQIRRDFRSLADHIQAIEAEGAGVSADAGPSPPDRIVLYIDDLDRCEPRRVVEVLQAVHLLLAFELFVVVVAVDPRWLLRALKVHYPDMLLDPERQAHGAGGDETPEGAEPEDTDETSHGTYMATPRDYLEKIFQIPYSVPAMGPAASREYLRDLVERTDPSPPEPPGTPGDEDAGVVDGNDAVGVDGVDGDEGDEGDEADGDDVPASGDGSDAGESDSAVGRWMRSLGRHLADIWHALRSSSAAAASDPWTDEGGTEDPTEGEGEGDALEAADDVQAAAVEAGVDANPKSLEMSELERKQIVALGPLFRSPRSSKRFVNVYRLLRATIPEEKLESFEGTEAAPGPHREVAMLLGAVLEHPDLAPELLDRIRKRDADGADAGWLAIVKSPELVARAKALRLTEDLGRLQTFSGEHPGAETLSLEGMAEWVNRVERFTFAR